MAQRSLPQAGTGVGDAGPYTSDEWAEYFQTVYTGDQQATQGPIRYFLNELEVTEAALAVTTDTGAGFVYGHFLTNDTAVVINIALAAAGLSRWDLVVMVQNNTNAAYNTNLALPAAYAAGVPRNSARIAILQGVEGAPGIPRVLLTGPNYYMVELARYQVTDAAVGTVIDYREFCEYSHVARTREFYVPAITGWNADSGTFIALGGLDASNHGIILLDGVNYCGARGHTIVPMDYVSGLTSTGVLLHLAGGIANINGLNGMYTGLCGGGASSHSSVLGPQAAATAGNDYYSCLLELDAPSEIEVGEILELRFLRYGASASDTLGEDILCLGWIIKYTADS